MTVANGVPGPVKLVPGVSVLHGITCFTSTTCQAVGSSTGGEGVYVPIANGNPGLAQVARAANVLNGIVCPGVYACYAVGMDGGGAVVVLISMGSPGAAQRVAATRLNAVASSSSSECYAVGTRDAEPHDLGVVVKMTNGTVGSYAAGQRRAGALRRGLPLRLDVSCGGLRGL